MKRYSIVLILAILAPIAGCIQQESTTSCAADAESAIGDTSDKPNGAGGSGGGANGIGDNQACSAHSDCASDECVPTIVHLPDATGMCWSEAFSGCALVDFEPWVIDAICGERDLVVCQLVSTPEMQANCEPPAESTAPWIANFVCCDAAFL